MSGKNSTEAAILLWRLILVFPFKELKKIARHFILKVTCLLSTLYQSCSLLQIKQKCWGMASCPTVGCYSEERWLVAILSGLMEVPQISHSGKMDILQWTTDNVWLYFTILGGRMSNVRMKKIKRKPCLFVKCICLLFMTAILVFNGSYSSFLLWLLLYSSPVSLLDTLKPY